MIGRFQSIFEFIQFFSVIITFYTHWFLVLGKGPSVEEKPSQIGNVYHQKRIANGYRMKTEPNVILRSNYYEKFR